MLHKRLPVFHRSFLLPALAALCWGSLAAPGRAAGTYPVTTLADSGAGSLRAAMTLANADPGATVVFAQGVTGTIHLASALPLITTTMTIQGPGAGAMALDGGATSETTGSHVFDIGTPGIATISDLTIQHGSDAQENSGGGGLHSSGVCALTRCVVTGNYNAGIYNNSQSITLTACTISQNAVGGLENIATATVVGCAFTGNTSVSQIAHVGYTGGAVDNDGTLQMTGCLISGNSANYGGGVGNSGGTATLTDCTLTGNSAVDDGSGLGDGGGAYNQSGALTLTNCTVTGNTAVDGGGVGSETTLTLTNCTFTGNTGSSGVGGLFIYQNTAATLTNDILYGDSGGEIGGTPTATYCDIQGGYSGTNNINADPLFVNAPADLHLKPGSPCLGAGTPTGAPATTEDGQTRPNPPSIGAYELEPTHAQLLWHNVSGQAALWNVNPDGTFSSAAYGPFSGWTAKAVSEAPDGADWLLWTNTSGEVSLWRVSALTASGYTTVQYGPYPGYQAVSLSIGSDGNPRLLWNETSGVASLWDINKSTGAFTHAEYGPYAGWTANEVASGATVTDLLWTNTNGTAAGWRIAANGALTTSAFGPFTNYSAVGLSVGPDDGAHLLWDSTGGSEALWSADFTTGAFSATSYDPISGWATKAIATGPDNTTRMLWDNTNGEASLWDVTGSGFTHQEFGPFSGWTAVGVSAGP